MPTAQSAWVWVDLGLKMDDAELAAGDIAVVGVPVPVVDRGTIVAVRMGALAVPTAAFSTVAVYKTGGISLTSLASTLWNAVTTGTVYNVPLQSGIGIEVTSSDMLYASYHIKTADVEDGLSVMVAIEPNTW